MLSRLRAIPNLNLLEDEPLRRHTRFAIGGQAQILADASTEEALAAALAEIGETGRRCALIGGGSNLIVADEGFELLDAPIRRVAAACVPLPFADALEDEVIPTADKVVTAIRSLAGY